MSRSERPSAGARARFMRAAAYQRPTRPGTWSIRLALAGSAAVLWLLAMLWVLGIRSDWHDLPVAALAATTAGLLASALVASMAGLARGRTMVGASTESLTVAAWGIPGLLVLLVLFAEPRGPSTPVVTESPLLHGWPCASLVLLSGLPLLALGCWVLRDLVLSRPRLVGACVGLAAATWAHLLIRIHCPLGGSEHALVGHLLPLLPLMMVGAWALRRR